MKFVQVRFLYINMCISFNISGHSFNKLLIGLQQVLLGRLKSLESIATHNLLGLIIIVYI